MSKAENYFSRNIFVHVNLARPQKLVITEKKNGATWSLQTGKLLWISFLGKMNN